MNNLPQVPALLASIALLLISALAVGLLFEKLKLPRVIGEIIGGLLLGPTLLTYFSPGAMGHVFTHSELSTAVLPILSQLGLVLLMFVSGAHLRSFVQGGKRKTVAVLAVIGIAIPFAIGLVVERYLDTTALQGTAHNATSFLLVFATAVAIASIPVISRIMMDLGIMNTSFARIVISTAVIDDLVLYVVLAIALALARAPGTPEHGLPALLGLDSAGAWGPAYHILTTVFLILFVLLAGPSLVRRASSTRLKALNWDNGIVPQMMLLAAVTALSLFLNLNPIFGALVAGMVVGRDSAQAGREIPKSLQIFGQKFFIPIYFALVGYKLDLIRHFDPQLFVGFLAFACIVKIVSIYIGARLASQSHSTAVNLAAALNARGGPGIVLASVAFEAQIINENFYAVLVLTAIATSLLAGAWLGRRVRHSAAYSRQGLAAV